MRFPSCNQAHMRRLNCLSLLHWLYSHGPTARTELARQLGLDTKTVTNLVRELSHRGCLARGGKVASGPGRPREMLRLKQSHLLAIGLHLDTDALHGAIVDLGGKLLRKEAIRLSAVDKKTDLVRRIRRLVQVLAGECGKRLLGVGLASPGLVDRVKRQVIACAHLPAWEGVFLDEVLPSNLRCPVRTEDFTAAKALAERWFGAARNVEDFFLIDAGVGIGSALFSQGQLHRGTASLAGEFGHAIIRPNGPPCACGRRGCLETVASLKVIRQAVSRRRKCDPAELNVAVLARMLSDRDPVVRGAIQRAASGIGLALANTLAILNPSHVILTGETARLGPPFLRAVDGELRRFAIPLFCQDLHLRAGELGDDAAILGAAILVLQSFFEP